MNVITFYYVFSQSSNILTHRKGRIAFFCGLREYFRILPYWCSTQAAAVVMKDEAKVCAAHVTARHPHRMRGG
jgi:hypothetical protein